MKKFKLPTDLNDEQWELVESFLPEAKYGGRPRHTCMRSTVNAILYVVRTGCQWRMLPPHFPPWQTVYRYFVTWHKRGVGRRVYRALYRLARIVDGREETPSVIVLDSQSVKTGKAGGERGFDGGKRVKGRKRHAVVDTSGLMLDVAVTAANVHDKRGGQAVLKRIAQWCLPQPKILYADGAYSGEAFEAWVKKTTGATLEIGSNMAQVLKRFIPSKQRWVIERTFAWFGDFRRLDKDHERLVPRSVAMLRWAMCAFMLRRLSTA